MKKINILFFWKGNQTIIDETRERLKILEKKYNINYSIGPTEKEEIELLKFKFYKLNKEIKRYSFMSDFYRIYKMYHNEEDNTFYIDINTKINSDRFDEFKELIAKHESIVIRENGYIIWNGFICTKNKNILKNVMDFYKMFPVVANKLTGPLIYSLFFYREYGCRLNNKNVCFLDSRDIDPYSDDSFFNYNGLGSWGNNVNVDYNNRSLTGAHSYFHKNANKFRNNKISRFNIVIRWCIKHYFIYLLPYVYLKKLFLIKRK